MRQATFSLHLSLALIAVFAIAPLAAAQDEFDDEFADEFDDGFGEEEAPAEEPTQSLESDMDEFDDFEDEAPPEETADVPGDVDEAIAGQRFRMHNTIYGPTGGMRLVDANAAASGTFRLQLATEYFNSADFLNPGDDNFRIGGTLGLSWALHDLVEINASLSSYANSNNTEEPSLFQVLGDMTLGVKVGASVTPWLALGGDLQLSFLNTVGDIGVVLGSTSMGFRGNLTADFRRLSSPVPLLARLNFQYFLDNSSVLIEDVETARYNALPDAEERINEDRHLVTRVERFALGVNRTDFFNIGIGLEAPLRAAEDFYISPMLEWNVGIPVNRQGYSCLFRASEPGSPTPVEGVDGCLDQQGVTIMDLSLGVRVLPPVEGLSAFLGVDIGIDGTSTFVRELAGNAPYTFRAGLGYAYDTADEPPPEPVIQEVERRVEVNIPPPPKGRINGLAVEAGGETPVPGAIIAFGGQDLTSLVTGASGRFTSYQFDPGEVSMTLSAPAYNDGACVATIPEEGGDVEVRCELTAMPRVGTVAGRLTGDGGAAVEAEIVIAGPASRAIRSDAAGAFNAADLPPGEYTARVTAEGHLIKTQGFEIVARETATVNITLVPTPRNPLVRLRQRDIQIRRNINFATDSAEILDSSFGLMDEIADVMIRNPQVTGIEIQGHTDNSGRAAHNQQLSTRRAESVRTWLMAHGVEGGRLTSVGHGADRPLVPNITPANRARNRRVQFVITAQGEAEE